MKYTILATMAALALATPALAQDTVLAGDPAALISAHKSGEMLVVHPANPPSASRRNAGTTRQVASATSDPYPAGAKDPSDKDFSDTGNDGGK